MGPRPRETRKEKSQDRNDRLGCRVYSTSKISVILVEAKTRRLWKRYLSRTKKKYLKAQELFDEVPDLSEKRQCLHCNQIFTVGDYKVFKDRLGFENICCPNAPKCSGTVIDWMPVGFDQPRSDDKIPRRKNNLPA